MIFVTFHQGKVSNTKTLLQRLKYRIKEILVFFNLSPLYS